MTTKIDMTTKIHRIAGTECRFSLFISLLATLFISLTACSKSDDENTEPAPEAPTRTLPESIKIDNDGSALTLNLPIGGSAELTFQVEPADAEFCYDTASSLCEVSIAGSEGKASPGYYYLSSVAPACDESGNARAGYYTATIADNGSGATYSDAVNISITISATNASSATSAATIISSSSFNIKSDGVGDVLREIALPIVYINTPDGVSITSKEVWTSGVEMKILDCTDGKFSTDYEGTLSMKGRGNTTWGYPKKPYALKLDSKSKILGMKKHKRWCLLANWMDRTLMRNAVAFEIAHKTTGMDWNPGGRYVELVLNGTHMGNYWLCEQIKVDENRVNITELDSKATSGDAITGGYIFELDVYYDEECKFRSAHENFPYMFKDPDEVNEAQMQYCKNFVDNMEYALYDAARFAKREFAEYIDFDSFIDYWFVYELTMNGEPTHPKSTYMYKDADSKGGKMKAGPVWDFDWGTFLPANSQKYLVKKAVYYDALFEDAEFRQQVKLRWEAQKSKFAEIPAYIDSLKEALAGSDKVNIAKWPISSTANGDENMSFNEAVARLKRAYEDKLAWLDKQIGGM